MLSALLPGVREFRTPLITGLLWGACLWLLVGSQIAASQSTSNFLERYNLGDLPPSAWFAVCVMVAYLLGSLLVIRTSPIERLNNCARARLNPLIERADEERVPTRRRYRPLWHIWRWRRLHSLTFTLSSWSKMRDADAEPIDTFLANTFDVMAAEGRIPVMRNYEGGCNAPTGFRAFYSTDSVRLHERRSNGDNVDPDNFYPVESNLAHSFTWAVKQDKSAVEVRIQMRFPEVYAEIDRLKVEAELRMSIFWPLLILCLILGWVWSPWSLVGLAALPFMLRDGFQRQAEASSKTWSALIAGEVSTPTLEAMESARDEKVRDFVKDYSRSA